MIIQMAHASDQEAIIQETWILACPLSVSRGALQSKVVVELETWNVRIHVPLSQRVQG